MTFVPNLNVMVSFSPPLKLQSIATGKNVILLVMLFLTFVALIMPSMENDIKALSGGVGVIDLQLFYTPGTALQMLNSYGPEGMRLYLVAQWTVDLIFPVIACLMFATLLLWLGLSRWWWLGMLVMSADWIENVLITILLVQYPDFSPWLAMVSCFFTSLKWAAIFFCNLLILSHFVKKLMAIRKSEVKQSRSA
jgi:hypothetical protein